MNIQKKTCQKMIFFAFCFVALGALYIYGINKTAVRAFGKSVDNKRITEMEEEVRALETERAHLAIGSWLETRAQRYELVAAGKVHVLSRDVAIVRAE